MAVHVPLSEQAKYEAAEIMRSTYNLLKPASGDPVVTPSNDMILGCFYLTSTEKGLKGEGKIFADKEELLLAYQNQTIDLRALVKVKINGEVLETTAGRVIFNNILPPGFAFLNEELNKKAISRLVRECFIKYGQEETAKLVDKIKDLGFHYASISGITVSISDIHIPQLKEKIIAEAESNLKEIDKQYHKGLITNEERYEKSVEIWMEAKTQIEKAMLNDFYHYNPVYMMVHSGARGSIPQLTQIAGMKGMVVNPSGEIIELPVRSNFKEGFSVFEYFISTHGARKGRSDTALRTSDAGYLTRRLVDVAQDIVTTEGDCQAKGIEMTREESEEMGIDFRERIRGRFLAEDIKELGLKKGDYLDWERAKQIAESKVEKIMVRSPLNCQAPRGICQKCYGEDLARGGPVKAGEAVGIIAAQAIGEPGTQLTMRTFHIGGIVGEDITQGLPRVEELFEARKPRFPALVAEIKGKVKIKEKGDTRVIEIVSSEYPEETIITEGYHLLIKNGDKVEPKQAIASAFNKKAKRASIAGIAQVHKDKVIIKAQKPLSKVYIVPAWVMLKVKSGDLVTKGQPLVEGHLDLHQMLKLVGRDQTAKYIVKEVQSIYASQGQTINEKHIEIIVRQMFSLVKIIDPKDSLYLEGQLVDKVALEKEIENLKKKNKNIPQYEELIR